MHEIAVLFAQVALVIVGLVASLAGIALVSRVVWRLTSRVKARESLGVSPSDFRRLETAVDAIAVEVERIGEAQRFTVSLLSERVPAGHAEDAEVQSAPAALPRLNTPH